MNLAATIKSIIDIVGTSDGDLAGNTSKVSITNSYEFTTGAGANQANEKFTDTRTLANNTSEELDLSGSLVNAFGVTVAFARIKFIQIKNKSSTQTLTIGGAASNAFVNWVGDATDTLKIPPGGEMRMVAPDATGWPVTAGTGDKLKIANGNAGQSADYDIILMGALT